MNNRFVLRKSNQCESLVLMEYQCNEKFGNYTGNRIGNLPFDIKANLMISIKMKIVDSHKISCFLMSVDTLFVGVAGFEPTTSCSQGVPPIFSLPLQPLVFKEN